ncbi:MAG: hypothetical protein M3Y23_00750, partial [Actinomycetota bacterium]|nr:hypothetical protein [Actinomycetota bacterium]
MGEQVDAALKDRSGLGHKYFHSAFALILGLIACLMFVDGASGTGLDRSFGDRGRLQTNIAMNQVARGGYVQNVQALPGGGFIAAILPEERFDRLVILRFAPDGSLDRSFAENGRLRPGFGYFAEFLSDGKILVAGSLGSGTPGQDVAVRRFTANGAIDRSFARRGLFRHDFGAQDSVRDMKVSSEGRILLSSNVFCHATSRVCYDSTSDSFVLTVLSPDGRLIRSSRGAGVGEGFSAIAAADDGSFRALTGTGPDGETREFSFVRIGRDLKITTIRKFGDGLEWSGLTMLPGNGFYSFADEGNSDTVVKVAPDGVIDPGFGDGGRAGCEGFTGYRKPEMELDGQGRVLAGGSTAVCSLFRLLPDGTFDPSFGEGGKVDLPDAEDIPWNIAPDETSGVLLARWDYSNGSLEVRRLTEAGTPDGAFGTVSSPVLQASQDVAKAVLPVKGGLILGGTSNCSGYAPALFECQRSVLVKLGAGGRVRSGFGDAGRVLGNRMSISALAGAGGGEFVAAGGIGASAQYEDAAGPGFAVARHLRDGRLDGSFGDGGIVYTRFAGKFQRASALAVDVQPDGKVVVTGEILNEKRGVATSLPVVRYNPDGSLDQGFGDGGMLRVELNELEKGAAIQVLRNGRILIAGRDRYRPLVMRLRPDGRIDKSFGSAGFTRPKLATRSRHSKGSRFRAYREATSLLLLRNGSMLVGAADGYGGQDGVVFKLRRDGKLDRGFGRSGALFTGGLSPNSLAADRCGRVTVSGTFRKAPHGPRSFALTGLRERRVLFPFGRRHTSRAAASAVTRGRIIAVG